jgi:RNA polymerase sigma-70 factor, ECF subfamily
LLIERICIAEEFNRAVAVPQAQGEKTVLRLLDPLEAKGDLAGYRLLPAARADLLRRLGRATEAALARLTHPGDRRRGLW